jgi:hypothetical protein
MVFSVAAFHSDYPDTPFEVPTPWLDAIVDLRPKEVLALAGRVLTIPDRDLTSVALLGRDLITLAMDGLDLILSVYDQVLFSLNSRIAAVDYDKKAKERDGVLTGDIEKPEDDQMPPPKIGNGELPYIELMADEVTAGRTPYAIMEDEYPKIDVLERDEVQPIRASYDGWYDEALEAVDLSPETDDSKRQAIFKNLLHPNLKNRPRNSHVSPKKIHDRGDDGSTEDNSPSKALETLVAVEIQLAETVANNVFVLETARERFASAFEVLHACFHGYAHFLAATGRESEDHSSDECLPEMKVAIYRCLTSYRAYGNAFIGVTSAIRLVVPPDNPCYDWAIDMDRRYGQPIRALDSFLFTKGEQPSVPGPT